MTKLSLVLLCAAVAVCVIDSCYSIPVPNRVQADPNEKCKGLCKLCDCIGFYCGDECICECFKNDVKKNLNCVENMQANSEQIKAPFEVLIQGSNRVRRDAEPLEESSLAADEHAEEDKDHQHDERQQNAEEDEKRSEDAPKESNDDEKKREHSEKNAEERDDEKSEKNAEEKEEEKSESESEPKSDEKSLKKRNAEDKDDKKDEHDDDDEHKVEEAEPANANRESNHDDDEKKASSAEKQRDSDDEHEKSAESSDKQLRKRETEDEDGFEIADAATIDENTNAQNAPEQPKSANESTDVTATTEPQVGAALIPPILPFGLLGPSIAAKLAGLQAKAVNLGVLKNNFKIQKLGKLGGLKAALGLPIVPLAPFGLLGAPNPAINPAVPGAINSPSQIGANTQLFIDQIAAAVAPAVAPLAPLAPAVI